jgi:hypothetical protein
MTLFVCVEKAEARLLAAVSSWGDGYSVGHAQGTGRVQGKDCSVVQEAKPISNFRLCDLLWIWW